MIDQISVFLATPIAKIILNKLYEGLGSKLGEKAIEAASAPIQKLGQIVWSRCFKGKPGTDQLLEAAAQGSEQEFNQIRDYLFNELENREFADVVQPLAKQIYQVLVDMDDINTRNSMQVFGGEGFQNNDSQAPIFQGLDNSPININYNYGDKPGD